MINLFDYNSLMQYRINNSEIIMLLDLIEDISHKILPFVFLVAFIVLIIN
jgi:hypothetical protein